MLYSTWSNFYCFPKDFLCYFGSCKTCSFSTSPDVFYSLICVVGKITSKLKVCLKKKKDWGKWAFKPWERYLNCLDIQLRIPSGFHELSLCQNFHRDAHCEFQYRSTWQMILFSRRTCLFSEVTKSYLSINLSTFAHVINFSEHWAWGHVDSEECSQTCYISEKCRFGR